MAMRQRLCGGMAGAIVMAMVAIVCMPAPEARAQITLREELEVARIYQRIEQLRLGDRLQVRWKGTGWRVGVCTTQAIA